MKERTIAMAYGERCLKPRCHREAKVLGLCRTHYYVAWDLVNRGLTTWEKLRRAGKIADRKRDAKEWFLNNA